jgi:hypothetical protein
VIEFLNTDKYDQNFRALCAQENFGSNLEKLMPEPNEDCAIAQISGMALTGRVCEPRSARQRSTPACMPPLQNCRKSGAPPTSGIAASPREASSPQSLKVMWHTKSRHQDPRIPHRY